MAKIQYGAKPDIFKYAHFVIARANLFTNHRTSCRATYKHFKTICEHTFDNSLILLLSMMVIHVWGIFSFLHIACCSIFVHPLFPVIEPHVQKWVIFVRHRPCVCDTFRFQSPPLPEKKIDLGTDSLLLPPADYVN